MQVPHHPNLVDRCLRADLCFLWGNGVCIHVGVGGLGLSAQRSHVAVA